MLFTGILGGLAAATLAIASPATQKLCTKSYNANFDKLATSVVQPLNKVPVPYDALHFTSFRVASNGLVSTIAAHSAPNSIGFNILEETLEGTPSLTRHYPGSVIQHFNATSLYLGCVTINPTGVFLPVGCSVEAVGTKIGGGKVFTTLDFVAPTIPNLGTVTGKKTQQQKQTFPESFCNLDNIKFTVVDAGVAPSLTAVAFDNVAYSVYYKCSDCKDGCSSL